MSPAIQCHLCHKLLAGSFEGQAAHMRRYHAIVMPRTYMPMDPMTKARIVQAVEARLGDKIIGGNGYDTIEITKAYVARTQARQLLIQTTDDGTKQELEQMIDALTKIIRGLK